MPSTANSAVAQQLGENPVAERLFTFVAIAYTLSIRTVFPVIYDTLKEGWDLINSLPDAGPGVASFGGFLVSERFWILVTPYCDKFFLSLSLLLLWAGYFFLMACIRNGSNGRYTVGLVAVDLAQSWLLYATAASLANYTEKSPVETDTSWLGMLGAIGLLLGRVLFGMMCLRNVTGGPVDKRLQYTCRTLLDLALISSVGLTLVYLAFRLDFALPKVEVARSVLLTACAVGLLAVMLTSLTTTFLIKRGGQELQYLRECWEWGRGCSQNMFILVLCTIGAVGAFGLLGNWVQFEYVSFSLKDAVPLGAGVLLVIVIGVFRGVWHHRHFMGGWFGHASGFRSESKEWLRRATDQLDRIVHGTPFLGLYQNDNGSVQPIVQINNRKHAAIALMAAEALLKPSSMPNEAIKWQSADGSPILFGEIKSAEWSYHIPGSSAHAGGVPIAYCVAMVRAANQLPSGVLVMTIDGDGRPQDPARSAKSMKSEVCEILSGTAKGIALNQAAYGV